LAWCNQHFFLCRRKVIYPLWDGWLKAFALLLQYVSFFTNGSKKEVKQKVTLKRI